MFRIVLWAILGVFFLSPSWVRAADSGGILLLSPSSLDFGAVEPGAVVLEEVTIANQGTLPLPLSIGVEGSQAGQFGVRTDGCPTVLTGSCTATVEFHPSRVGRATARLVVRTPEFEEVASLTGSGGNGSRLMFDPGIADFGTVSVSGPVYLTVPVGNVGGESFHITRITPPPPPFSLVSDYCSGRSLPANSKCHMTVRFNSEVSGAFSGDLGMSYSDTAPRIASLSMKGVRTDAPSAPTPSLAAAPNAPDLRISTEFLDFGPVTTGKEQLRSVTVRNLGTVVGSVGSITLPSEPFFIAEDGCSGRRIGPGGSCRIGVRIAPAVTGLVQSAFDLPTGSQGNLQVRLRGQGVDIAIPAIMVRDRFEWEEDLDLPFGERFLGRSVVTTVTVGNIGSAPLTIPEAGVTNSLGRPFFLRSDGCSGQSLPPAGECNIQVRFAPFSAGGYNETLEIRSDDPRFPNLSMNMSGAGVVAAGNVPPAAPVLIHPDPNQTSLRDTITFRWSRCDDPDGDPVFYQLFLSKTDDLEAVESRLAAVPEGLRLAGFGAASLGLLAGMGLSPRRRKLVISLLLLTSVLMACSDKDEEDNVVLEIGNLDPMTTYFWKVLSDDGRGGLAESEIRSFTTR